MVSTNKDMQNFKESVIGGKLPVQITDIEFVQTLPTGELAAILGAIENATAPKETNTTNRLVHFTSTYSGESADVIAVETAFFAATQEGKKVLIVDVAPYEKNICAQYGLRPQISLDQYALSLEGNTHAAKAPIINIKNTELSYAVLFSEGKQKDRSFNTKIAKEVFSTLRNFYDVIIVHSEGSLKSGVAASLAPLTDGTLLVIQAERTRTPVAKELVETIRNSGGEIIGSVMSNRKYYIPQWLYGLLFKTQGRDCTAP